MKPLSLFSCRWFGLPSLLLLWGLLCDQLGTSRSTLERSFKAYYGIGPKNYIKLVRLHRLHHQLRRAGPEARVTEMAMDQGFWHMGQLGRDYLRHFGCLPSETLKSKIL